MKSLNDQAKEWVEKLVRGCMAQAAKELSHRAVELSKSAVELRREAQRVGPNTGEQQ